MPYRAFRKAPAFVLTFIWKTRITHDTVDGSEVQLTQSRHHHILPYDTYYISLHAYFSMQIKIIYIYINDTYIYIYTY